MRKLGILFGPPCITGEYKGGWGGEGDKKLIFGPLGLELRPKTLKPN